VTLRSRLAVLLVVFLAVVAVATALVFRFFFLGTFEDLEERQLVRTAVETRRLALEQAGRTAAAAIETASLPSVRRFLEGGDARLVLTLADTSSWAEEGLDAVVIYNSSGTPAYASGIVRGEAASPFPPGLSARISESGFSSVLEDGESRCGVLFSGSSPWFVGACEVRPSVGDGAPVGVVVFADRIDGGTLDGLNFMPGNRVGILAPEAGPPGIDPSRPSELILRTGMDKAVVYATLGAGPGLDVILKIESPREVYGLGRDTADRAMLFVLIAGMVLVAVTILLFQGEVMMPLRTLTLRIREIGDSSDPSMRCGIPPGDDEFSLLASTLDATLDRLERASLDLRQSRQRFDLFAKYLPGYSYIRKPDGRLVYANENFRRDLLGSREDWEGIDWKDVWPAEQASVLARSDDEVMRNRRPVLTELDVRIGDGAVRRLLFHSFPVGPESDGTLLLGGIAVDVTDRVRIEEMLLGSEMRNEAILSAIPESVLVISSDGRIIDVKAGSDSGSSGIRDRLQGRNIEEIGLSSADVSLAEKTAAKCLQLRSVESIELAISGGPMEGVYECRMAPFENDAVVCTVRNVTEKRRMESEILESQKQESISLMAGGIAHDFKNIMSVVTGSIDLCAASEPGGSEAAGYLASALDACDKALMMLRQLEMLSRGSSGVEKRALDLESLLGSTARLVMSGSGVQLSLQVQAPGGLWKVEADEGQMVQAFSNFIVNAREALDGSGRLDIRLWNGMTRAGEREVRVSLADNGPGMNSEVLERIYDPYFSTKSRGSGLGLAVASSIVKRHGGRIEVESSPGRGTVFTVSLPAAPRGTDNIPAPGSGPARTEAAPSGPAAEEEEDSTPPPGRV